MREVLSPNFSSGWPYGKPQAVMIHSTRSGQNWSHAQELESALNWFKNPDSQASAHLVVSPEEVVRVVADENRAWTAGQHNGYAHQIELTQALTTTPYEEGHYRNLVAVVQPYILAGVPIRYEPFYVNNRKGFTGHEDSTHGQQNGKSDPGDLFDWPKFIGMLRGETEEEDEEMSVQHQNQHMVASWFFLAAGFANDGAPLPDWLHQKLSALLAYTR